MVEYTLHITLSNTKNDACTKVLRDGIHFLLYCEKWTLENDPVSFILCRNADFFKHFNEVNRIGGIVVCVLASSAVDRRFESWSGQTINYKFVICCFSAKQAALRRKYKDWLARNQYNVSELGRHVYPRTVVSVS